MKSIFQFFTKKKNTITTEEFAEIRRAFNCKKKDILKQLKEADNDLMLKDILLKELSQAETQYQKISQELWGYIPPHGKIFIHQNTEKKDLNSK